MERLDGANWMIFWKNSKRPVTGIFTQSLLLGNWYPRSEVFWTLCLYKRAETVALQTPRKLKQTWPLGDQVDSPFWPLFSWKSKIRVDFPNRFYGGEPWPAHLRQHRLLWWQCLPYHSLSKGGKSKSAWWNKNASSIIRSARLKSSLSWSVLVGN